ncbi:hypothetical protein B0H14DRAFT_3091586 [Mycena olivaceomarginata]|nr:hypothetical protein B0H14DRAFT_3091586 [Mycena olivaceomarginata]
MISFKIGDIVPADCRLADAVTVSIDEAALMGESLPKSKKSGDFCFRRGSICKQGEAEADDSTGHLQMILVQIGSFYLVVIGIFVLAEILVLYVGFCYSPPQTPARPPV